VIVLVSVNLLNIWAPAYQIPLPLQTVFRSGGLAVSMLFGWGYLGRRYSKEQVVSTPPLRFGFMMVWRPLRGLWVLCGLGRSVNLAITDLPSSMDGRPIRKGGEYEADPV